MMLVFSENWVLLVFIMFILGAVLQHSELLLISMLMTITSAVGWIWNSIVLKRVEYTRALMTNRAFVGERVALCVTLTNRKALPVPWIRVDDAFPNSLTLRALGSDASRERRLEPSSSAPGRVILRHLTTLGPFERVRWNYEIGCEKRGFFFLGPAVAQSGDVFGFFARRLPFKRHSRLIVYPRVRPLPELGFPGKEPFGDKRVTRHLVEDPIRTAGVREYRPKDNIKRVHWKASARQGELQVKVYEPTITQQLVVFLNVASFAQTWRGIIPEYQEQAISVAASIAYHTVERRFAVGLIANGCVPYSDQPIKVPPSRAPEQLMRVLEALAAVTAFATTDIEKLLLAESPRLPLGATLVLVTTIVTDSLTAEMLRLRDAGRRLALVSLDPEYLGNDLPNITTYHLPPARVDDPQAWKRPLGDESASQRERWVGDRTRWASLGRSE